MFQSRRSIEIFFRLFNTKFPTGDVDLLNTPYYGFLIFSRKKCGNEFLSAVANGDITFDVLDKYHAYITSHQFAYLRNDGPKTSVTIQYR